MRTAPFDVWQGEGPHVGRRCWFLRLGLCNLHCSWCDTAFTWDRDRFNVTEECPPTSYDELTQRLPVNLPMLVLTGGEPLIHANNPVLRRLLTDWLDGAEVHVETNGTLIPPPWLKMRVDHWSVSPKVNPQGDPAGRRLPSGPMRWWVHATHATIKVVCASDEDVGRAVAWSKAMELPPERLWIMPEGTTPDAVLGHAKDIADAVHEAGANLTLRDHVLMYGSERAR
jgi:organic radical activating enzyme